MRRLGSENTSRVFIRSNFSRPLIGQLLPIRRSYWLKVKHPSTPCIRGLSLFHQALDTGARVMGDTCFHHMWGWATWPGPGQYTGSADCHIIPPATCAAFFLCVSACLTILSSLMNPFPQTSQVNGFSPVCRHMWRLKSVLWLNCFGQTSHL